MGEGDREHQGDDPAWVIVLDRLRRGIERISDAGGWLAKYIVLVIFAVGILNVIFRYYGRTTNQQLVSNLWLDTQWQLFGVLFLIGFGHGVKEGVNPRVDFWHANFSRRRKATIDLVFHSFLLLPFCWLGARLLWPFGMAALGRRNSGTGTSWETWRVWEIWEKSNNPDGLPLGPIKALMIVGLFLFGLQVLAEIIKNAFVLLGKTHLADIHESDAPARIE